MLSHGTADVVLEACTDFWDGADIYPLSSSDRKKVLDFYQRACLSGYCSAFAYKPMNCALSSQLNGKCIELVQVPGQSSIFTMCELPSTVPIKQNARRNSWSSDGIMCFPLARTWAPRGRESRNRRVFRWPWHHLQQKVPQAAHRSWVTSVAFLSW